MVVVIVVDDRYRLQPCHNKQGVFFPNHWACFGGRLECYPACNVCKPIDRLEPSENAEAALCWELDEDSIRPGFPKTSVI